MDRVEWGKHHNLYPVLKESKLWNEVEVNKHGHEMQNS